MADGSHGCFSMSNGDEIELADGRASVVVRPREGAAILRYDALRTGRAPTPVLEPSRGLLKFGSQLLIPWSNRISGGGFEFDGRFHAIEPNVEGEPFPLHGDAFQRPWRLTRRTGTEMELALEDGRSDPTATMRASAMHWRMARCPPCWLSRTEPLYACPTG